MSPASLFWWEVKLTAQIEHAAACHGHPEAKAPGEKAVSEGKSGIGAPTLKMAITVETTELLELLGH